MVPRSYPWSRKKATIRRGNARGSARQAAVCVAPDTSHSVAAGWARASARRVVGRRVAIGVAVDQQQRRVDAGEGAGRVGVEQVHPVADADVGDAGVGGGPSQPAAGVAEAEPAADAIEPGVEEGRERRVADDRAEGRPARFRHQHVRAAHRRAERVDAGAGRAARGSRPPSAGCRRLRARRRSRTRRSHRVRARPARARRSRRRAGRRRRASRDRGSRRSRASRAPCRATRRPRVNSQPSRRHAVGGDDADRLEARAVRARHGLGRARRASRPPPGSRPRCSANSPSTTPAAERRDR